MRRAGGTRQQAMSSHVNSTPLSSKEIAQMIAAFLDKHGNNRDKVVVNDYQFVINSIYDIKIKADSIVRLYEDTYTYNGTVKLHKSDKVSGVSDKGKSYLINGTAFFAIDADGDPIIFKVEIGRIIQQN